jgi:transposase
MAAGLMQAPLPWLPEGATEIARGVGLVTGDDGSGQVWVHGMMTFCWQGGDETSRRLAAVQLAELKAASQKQVAAGFGATPVTVWRWSDAYRRDGVAGLIGQPRGPKGPSKVTPELAGRIRELAAGGSLSHRQVAQRCGVSEFTVRAVLGKVRARREAAARLAAGGDAAGDGAPGWAQEELPVLPDPVPRDAEPALARFGLLGEGAAPVFTPAAKVPYAGLLLALPALAGTGLTESARRG